MIWKVQAGPTAYAHLRRQGWNWHDFEVVIGASAGPKWLVLSALDRHLAPLLQQNRQEPLHLLGSSSGAYRFSAYVQDDPVQALRNLEEAYIDADWSPERPQKLIRQTAAGIVRSFLKRRPLRHPDYRLHIVTSLCHGWLAWDQKWAQILALLAGVLLNALGRDKLGYLVKRLVFSDPRSPLPARFQDLPTLRTELNESNHFEAVLASGAIPVLIPGERDLPGAPPGLLRDGGLVDYHFDQLHLHNEGLILYPHFADSLLPGWLERYGRKRRVPGHVLDRMVLISPKKDWIGRLPNGRIPERGDAAHLGQRERRRLWSEAARRGQDLADACRPDQFLQELTIFQTP
ncbi:MAG: patatin-like phospholipase family protein [Vulcanimicrobiota bacterium]